jgi:hypothetical protein
VLLAAVSRLFGLFTVTRVLFHFFGGFLPRVDKLIYQGRALESVLIMLF